MTEDNSKGRLENYLLKKYKRSVISKKELAEELGISLSTVDFYIAKKSSLPDFKKLGSAKNSKVIFNIYDVVDFITTSVKMNTGDKYDR
ncbi:MAG: hypothetical protein COA66_02895 [Arcobacter sp.]|nr:MAG: hypothetical protein COA66_02895 [Arcobacter sp.]